MSKTDISKTEPANPGRLKKTAAAKPTGGGTRSSSEKAKEPAKRKTPKKNSFEKMAKIRARMSPFAERVVGMPFAADLGDDKIDFMNRAEITIRVEKQFCEQILKMLEEYSREHPQAKLRAGTFNA